MTKEFTLPSGVAAFIGEAPWKDACALKRAIQKELASAPGQFDMKAESDASGLIKAFMHVDGSPEVETALYRCLARCRRGPNKINEETFDDPEARRDYYAIIAACLEINLAPLAEGLFSALTPFLATMKKRSSATPKSA